eukprot:6575-Heterococcus_DN1.PRE.1
MFLLSNAVCKHKYVQCTSLQCTATSPSVAAAAGKMAGAREKAAEERHSFKQPAMLTGGQLKPYQLDGVQWLASLFSQGLSGILADEMGLGKTIQASHSCFYSPLLSQAAAAAAAVAAEHSLFTAYCGQHLYYFAYCRQYVYYLAYRCHNTLLGLQVIGLLAYLYEKEVKGPYIICAPLATLPNWINEIKKWCPRLKCVLYHGPKADRDELRETVMHPSKQKDRNFPIVVTSFETCINDRAHLQRYTWRYMILDEGQRVKNKDCRLVRELKLLPTESRILLSGTPIQNTLEELWSLLNFVNPSIFDDLTVFRSWFGFKNIGRDTSVEQIVSEEEQAAVVTKLHEILRPFLLRRLKRDVLQ